MVPAKRVVKAPTIVTTVHALGLHSNKGLERANKKTPAVHFVRKYLNLTIKVGLDL
jgi:hypothetical protein